MVFGHYRALDGSAAGYFTDVPTVFLRPTLVSLRFTESLLNWVIISSIDGQILIYLKCSPSRGFAAWPPEPNSSRAIIQFGGQEHLNPVVWFWFIISTFEETVW